MLLEQRRNVDELPEDVRHNRFELPRRLLSSTAAFPAPADCALVNRFDPTLFGRRSQGLKAIHILSA